MIHKMGPLDSPSVLWSEIDFLASMVETWLQVARASYAHKIAHKYPLMPSDAKLFQETQNLWAFWQRSQ